MPHRFLVLFCGLLIATNAISTDILLPGLWEIAAALDAPIGQVQAVTPVFLFAAGFGQLLFGPASDRYGRRPILLAGLGLYVAGAGIAAAAGSIEVVIAGRFLQGLGGSAGIAVGRAMLRDLHHGPALAQAMATATSLVSIGPVLAPTLGLLLFAAGSWRLPFAAMVVFGLAMAALALLLVRETHVERDGDALRPSVLAAALRRVWQHPQSRVFLAISAIEGCTIVLFLTHAPRLVMISFGIDGTGLAILFAVIGSAIVIGQAANRIAIRRLGVLPALRLAATVVAAVGGAILASSLAGFLNVWLFGALMFTFNTCYLVVMANSLSLAIDPHKDIAGLVASLYGFLTMVVPGGLAIATLPLIRGDMLPWSATFLLLGSVVLTAVMLYRPAPLPAAAET